MSLFRKIITGFLFIVGLNYFMDFIVDQIHVDVQVLWWDVSGIFKAMMVTVMNMIAFLTLRGVAGMEGAVAG